MTHATYAALLDIVQQRTENPLAALLADLTRRHSPISGDFRGPRCQACQRLWPCEETVLIAEHVEFDLGNEATTAGGEPPAGTRRIRSIYSLAYVVSQEAWYAHVLRDGQNDLQVMARHPDGSVLWEFTVRQEHLGGDCLRLAMFNGAFAAFADIPDFFAALRTRSPATLNGLRQILDGLGAWDVTQRVRQ
jgi:hypothetical protein